MQSERVSGNRASLVRHVSGATGLEPNPSVTFHLRVISKTVSYKSSLYGSELLKSAQISLILRLPYLVTETLPLTILFCVKALVQRCTLEVARETDVL